MTFSNLNQEQADAVQTTDGPLLVLAGAGTGKTRVLTSRIINIVNSHLASPMQILAVTFTNKAAKEMKERMAREIGDQVNNLWVGTFHSVAAKILRRHPEIVGLGSDFTIIDADDQGRLLKQILADFNIDTKQFPAKAYLGKISRLKDAMAFPQNVKEDESGGLPKLKAIYESYQTRLKAMNGADFGDLLLYNIEIFKNAPNILAYYQDKFRYILVDEYQDTNSSQYQWLLSLATLHQNICCVGDDDQSIYSWRGADIKNILRFEEDFADAKIIRLEQNYRSTSNILDAADSVIKNNKSRHGKKLWTEVGQGSKVTLAAFMDDRSESAFVANKIADILAANKIKADEIAVLVRAGYQTRSFEEAFISVSIPYRVIGGMKFYERMEVRDSVAYMRICANLNDDLALNRIINNPKRGVGSTTIANILQYGRQNDISFFAAIKELLQNGDIKGKAKDSLQDLINKIASYNEQINDASLGEMAKNILQDFGYINMWESENSVESKGRLENINEFINSLDDFSTMTEFLEYISLVEAKDERNVSGEAVNIMTIHGAKGLEFDMVFVPGLEDGVFPSGKSIEEKNGVEEERRLMYVAITRAKKDLILSYAKSRYVYGSMQTQIPSRFLKELPQNQIDMQDASRNNFSHFSGLENDFSQGYGKFIAKKPNYKDVTDSMEGKRIFHQKFGYGTVIEVNGNKLSINFEKTGSKILMKDFVSLAD